MLLRVRHEMAKPTRAAGSARTRVRSNYGRGTHCQTNWPHHACEARRARYVAARMMPILKGVAERGPVQCTSEHAHEHGGWSQWVACTGRGRRAADWLLRWQGVPGRWGERSCWATRCESRRGASGPVALIRSSFPSRRVVECFDSGDGWSSRSSPMSRSTSVATAVAFTALCFACVGRIMANSLAAAQICAHGSLAQEGSSPQKRCVMRWGCALCSGTCSAIGTHHDLRSAAAGFGVRAGW